MRFLISIIFVLLFGCCFGENPQDKNFLEADLNEYIDYVTPFLREFLVNNGFDPMPIPDLEEGFSVKPLLIRYHGELELTQGQLTGLKSLARNGDFMVAYLNRLLKIKGDFAFKDIGFTYRYLCKIMNIGPTGGVVGKVTKISGLLEIMIDFNNMELHLQAFSLYDVGKITIKLTGNILVDWLSSAVINVITGLFKNIIVKVIESNLRDAIQDELDKINIMLASLPKPTDGMNPLDLIQEPIQKSLAEVNPLLKSVITFNNIRHNGKEIKI